MKFKKILVAIILAILVIVWVEWMLSFWSEHTYYYNMIFSWKNLWLILSALFSWWISLLFLSNSKKLSFKRFVVWTGTWLWIFAILHALINKSLLTVAAVAPLLFNTILVYLLVIFFVLWIFSLWVFISRKLKLFSEIRWQEVLLTFWLWLVVFLVIMQILMGIHLFYSLVIWLLFIWILVLAYLEKTTLKKYERVLIDLFQDINEKKQLRWGWIISVLFVISFAYYFFNFSHSFIPYSTAWDANHEYMYIPKVISENAGILRWNRWPAATMPYLWHGYIAFFFSLWSPLSSFLSIAKDTVAVNLNAFSWVLVLIFGLWALKEILNIFVRKRDEEKIVQSAPVSFLMWWSLLLMWLLSWMWAFLVFVDNKTDMWVLALSCLAMLWGFIFLNNFISQKDSETENKAWLKYLLISAVFFAFAIMAKPTAFIDVIIFALLLAGFWLNTTSVIWFGLCVLGFVWIVQPMFAPYFVNPALWKLFFIVWGIIIVIWVIRWLVTRSEDFFNKFKQIVIWWIALFCTMFIFKWSWIIVWQLVGDWFNFSTFVKNTLLAYAGNQKVTEKIEQPLLAQTVSVEALEEQNAVDKAALLKADEKLTLKQCKKENFSEEELNSTKQVAPWNTLSEDVWRYVGFWWRKFKKTWVGWLVLKLLFFKNNACYWWDKDWVFLCKNSELFEKQDVKALTALSWNLNPNWSAIGLLQDLVDEYSSWDDVRDEFTALETYYQEHSISTDEDNVYIPYRYIVPLNVVFNWSLQNHSSYYTDIWLIWLVVYVLIIWWAIYAVCNYSKRNKNLLILTASTIVWWIIWWTIGWGIVWYWLWLIIWSIFIVSAFFEELEDQKNEELKVWTTSIIFLVAFYILVQAIFNFSRIASQAASWPFEWYKSNVWTDSIYNDQLKSESKTIYNYSADKIFWLQFWQYVPIINAVADRDNEDWVLIAWTYIQYFLNNWRNIQMDWMLTWFWEEVSDFNSCRSYQRLKNENIKYLIIDPNIWTVWKAWEGNESLFYRFFARLNEKEDEIQTHWAITMLVKMAEEWYLRLIFTNNVWAKYAFTLSDSYLKEHFDYLKTEDDIILLRSKMAVMKYFYTDSDLLQTLFEIFQERILTWEGIWDIANMLWKEVDEVKLISIVNWLLQKKYNVNDISWLTQDERLVLAQYWWVLQLISDSSLRTQAQEWLTKLFQNSLFWSSQVIWLELL